MKQKFIEWFTKSNNGCSPAMEDDRSFVHEKTQHMFEAYQAGVAEGEARCAALAAENVALKTKANEVLRESAYVYSHYNRMVDHLDGESVDGQTLHELQALLSETLATDAYLAGIKADGRVEGINFAASRLAAAFNHGFVDKPMAEVGDMVRMILDAKADLANSPIPPEDGLSGEYAEKSLAEWEAVLREGADK